MIPTIKMLLSFCSIILNASVCAEDQAYAVLRFTKRAKVIDGVRKFHWMRPLFFFLLVLKPIWACLGTRNEIFALVCSILPKKSKRHALFSHLPSSVCLSANWNLSAKSWKKHISQSSYCESKFSQLSSPLTSLDFCRNDVRKNVLNEKFILDHNQRRSAKQIEANRKEL